MANNKIIYYGETLLDLSEDNVTNEDVTYGVSFHLPNGSASVGTARNTWGYISGTLSNQTDLQNALDGKQDSIEEYTSSEVETLWNSI